MPTPPNPNADSIDVNDLDAINMWAKKLDVSADQICEAVELVGNKAADIEMHLKGSHSTTNADRMKELGQS